MTRGKLIQRAHGLRLDVTGPKSEYIQPRCSNPECAWSGDHYYGDPLLREAAARAAFRDHVTADNARLAREQEAPGEHRLDDTEGTAS